MNPKIIPIEAMVEIDPILARVGRGVPPEFAKDHLKRQILAAVEKHIEFAEIAPGEVGPHAVMRAMVYLADGWGDAESMVQDLARRANGAMEQATHMSWHLDKERREHQAEMARARNEFHDRFQRSIEEFLGYDECVGRR
jgi:hypothetical protein